MAKRVSEINQAVSAAVAEALEQARENAEVIKHLRESAMNGTLTFRELKDRIPSTAGKKTPSEYVVRAFTSMPDLILCEKEYDYGGKLTVFINGFYTYSDGGWMTILRVDGFSKVYFDRTEDSFMTVGDEEYKNRSYDYPLTLHGDWQIRKNRSKVFKKYETCEIDDAFENYKNHAVCNDILNELVTKEDKKRNYKLLYQAIREMTDKQRMIAQMYYIKGMTHEEISKEIKKSRPYVTKTLNRCLLLLKKYFEKNL